MVEGLNKAIEIIEHEIEIAKKINIQMALGMAQVLVQIKSEKKVVEGK